MWSALCKTHAVVHEYSWSGSSRFAWSLGYVLFVSVAAYSVGLPGTAAQPAGRDRGSDDGDRDSLRSRSRLCSSSPATRSSHASWCSAPPSSSFRGSCCARHSSTRCANARAEERDRVLVVADADEWESLEADLARAPERPALVVGCADAGRSRAHEHSSAAPARRGRPAVSCDGLGAQPGGAGRRRHRAPGLDPARAGRADPYAVAVLRAVARQAPDRRARAGVAAVRHRRVAHGGLRAREAPASMSRWRSAAASYWFS